MEGFRGKKMRNGWRTFNVDVIFHSLNQACDAMIDKTFINMDSVSRESLPLQREINKAHSEATINVTRYVVMPFIFYTLPTFEKQVSVLSIISPLRGRNFPEH